MRSILAVLIVLAGAGVALAAPKLADQTIMTYSPGHGTQVEYYDKKGGTWLWYPGNKVVLPGRWKTESGKICFGYTPNSYNPVTGHTGASWECQPLKIFESVVVERAPGDVFGLSQRAKPPFSLPKRRTSIEALSKRLK